MRACDVIQLVMQEESGLPRRFAPRNDGERGRLPSLRSEIASLSCRPRVGQDREKACGRLSFCYTYPCNKGLKTNSISPVQHLKKLQLGRRNLRWLPFFSREDANPTKLSICDCEESDLARVRHFCAHTRDMGLGVLNRGAVARIDRKLHHAEPIVDEAFTKQSIRFSCGFGIGWQVEHGNNPHGFPPPRKLRDRQAMRHRLLPRRFDPRASPRVRPVSFRHP